MKSVDISDGVEYIGEEAFGGCMGLGEVRLPLSMEIITRDTFINCALEEVIITNSVKVIDEEAFQGCPLIKRVKLWLD